MPVRVGRLFVRVLPWVLPAVCCARLKRSEGAMSVRVGRLFFLGKKTGIARRSLSCYSRVGRSRYGL